ncbi:hypothetical protein BDN71DRAFT_1514764 [Pleurotus eryngii]|uniref:Uncharacterized protein n=1 Tax=Pleurotus eryngii TaxID=5323 RepID=A0A9P5ZFU4_PLEER|nr:hypothetical protein BDN71DRAFT_1514764 [Pleurotus eryngii]
MSLPSFTHRRHPGVRVVSSSSVSSCSLLVRFVFPSLVGVPVIAFGLSSRS